MNTNWTKEELKLLEHQELTDKEIAEILNRSIESVKKKRQRIGVVKVRGRKGLKGTFDSEGDGLVF